MDDRLGLKRRRTRPVVRTNGSTLALLTGAMIALAVARAPAQDALLSSLAVAQAVQPQTNPAVSLAPDQPYMGPVQLSLGFYSSVSFQDNITFSQANPQSDEILHAGVKTGFFWPATLQSQVSLNAGVGYAHYLKNSEYDYVEVAPNSALAWNVFFDDGSLTFFDQFSYSHQVVTEAALSGIATFPHYDNTIGTRASWLPNHWLLEAGYSHDDYFSDSAAYQYLNRSSEYFFARGAWRFAENTQAGLEASASLTSYRFSSQNDNHSLSLGPYAEWQITQTLRATLRGGPTIYYFDANESSSPSSTLDSYYAGLQVSNQLTSFLSQQVVVRRDVSLGLNEGSQYIEQLTVQYSLFWALTERIGLGAGFTYTHGTQPFQTVVSGGPGYVVVATQTEVFDQYAVGPTVSWQASDKLSASLSYNGYLRDSNLAGRGYTQNSVTLSFNYAF